MKRFFVSLAALFAIVATSGAQDFNFGVKAGMNLMKWSNITASNTVSAPLTPGIYIGAFGEKDYVLGPLGVRAEIMFDTENSQIKTRNTDQASISTAFNVNIPVMFQYKMLGEKLGVVLGPQLGLCCGGHNILKSNGSKTTTKWDKNYYNTFNVGIVLGASYEFYQNISVEARYNFGLTNILAKSTTNYAARGFAVGLAMKF